MAESVGIMIDEKEKEQIKGRRRTESLERILEFGGKADAYTEEEKEKLAAQKNTEYVELLEELTPADILPELL